MEMRKSIGAILLALRERSGESREMVAGAVGIGTQSLVRYEFGERTPKADVLARLAAHYGVSANDITGSAMDDGDIPKSTLSDTDFALNSELHSLTEEEKQDVLDYVRFKRSQRKK